MRAVEAVWRIGCGAVAAVLAAIVTKESLRQERKRLALMCARVIEDGNEEVKVMVWNVSSWRKC